jgi:hypothetical protein
MTFDIVWNRTRLTWSKQAGRHRGTRPDRRRLMSGFGGKPDAPFGGPRLPL